MKGEDEFKSQPYELVDVHNFAAVPGLLLLHTSKGVALLDPKTLDPVKIEALDSIFTTTAVDSRQYQFKVKDADFSIVKVWDIVTYNAPHKKEKAVGSDDTMSTGATDLNADSSESKPSPSMCTQENLTMLSATAPLPLADQTISEICTSKSGVLRKETNSNRDIHRKETDFGFGSCVFAFTINNRLLVVKVESR